LLGVLLAGGHQVLVAVQVVDQRVATQVDGVGFQELGLDLRDGPVPREAALPQPAEDVPTDQPPGQGERQLGGRAEGFAACRTSAVGAVRQATDQLQGPL
jgi:hypothetical protein